MCESRASNRQVNWNCSLVVTSTFVEGGRRQTDAAWLELRDRGGPLVMIASVRGVPDLFFFYVLWLFPRCLMVQRRLLCVCVSADGTKSDTAVLWLIVITIWITVGNSAVTVFKRWITCLWFSCWIWHTRVCIFRPWSLDRIQIKCELL